MKSPKVLTYARVGVLAGSLLLLPARMPISAQTTMPVPTTPRVETRVETRYERDYTGLWGLLGLLGLAGLMGRRRRPDAVGVYDTSTTPRTEPRTRP